MDTDQAKEMHLLEMESKLEELESSRRQFIKGKDNLHQAYNIKKIESSARDHYKRILNDLEQNAVKNCCLQAAVEEQRKVDEKLMKLAKEQKKQVVAKQALELEKLNVVKHMGDEGDLEVELLLKALENRKQSKL